MANFNHAHAIALTSGNTQGVVYVLRLKMEYMSFFSIAHTATI